MNFHTRYRSGGAWRAAVTPDAILILGPEVPLDTVRTAWRTLAGGGIAAVLDALTGAFGTSLTAIPPFALAVWEQGGVRVAVRGALAFEVVTASGSEVVSGAGASTWVERLIADVTALSFAPTEEEGSPTELEGSTTELDIRDGIVAVSRMSVSLTESASPPHDVLDTPEQTAPEPGEPGEAAPAERTVADLAEDVDPSATIDPRSARLEDADANEEAAAAEPDVAGAEVDLAVAEEEVAAPDPNAAPAEPTPPPADPEGSGAPAPSLTQTWHPAAATGGGAEVIEDTANAETIIRRKGNAPAEPDAQLLGDHDGHTIVVPASRRRGAERDTLESTRRPSRPAARHGRLRLSNGTVADLDGTIVIGRRPRAVRSNAEELPALITVDSPQQDISRSHVEIRVEGDHVLVTDLKTTNGTVLHRGSQEPVRLHPSEATMIVPGDLLDLGDGVTVLFEAAV